MESDNDLLSCPFCGEKAESGHDGNSCFIRCPGDFCGMCQIYGPDFDFESIRQAWNSRAAI